MTLPTPQQQISANQKLIRAIEADMIQRTHERQRRLSTALDHAFDAMKASADLQVEQLIEETHELIIKETNRLCSQLRKN